MNSLTSASVCPPWRHTVTGAHSERKRTRGFAPSTPASVFLLLALKRSRAVQKEEREREKRLSRNSSVKQYRVPLKTSDKKAHMIPELQSPIPSAKAASAFLSVWMLQQHGGEKKIQDKAKKKNQTGEMWQSNGHFHGEGETGAKGVILGLLWASKRWIKMVGYRAELHFCLFFSLSLSLCPFLISCKFELLSRPIKLATLARRRDPLQLAVTRVFRALYRLRWSL